MQGVKKTRLTQLLFIKATLNKRLPRKRKSRLRA